MMVDDRPRSLPSEMDDSVVPRAEATASEGPGSLEVGRSGRRLLWQLALGLVIAGVFIWIMREGAMPLVPHERAFAGVRWWTAGVYFLGWSVVHILRAARWQLLLAPIARVGLRRVFAASF